MTEINRITHWRAPATMGAIYETLLDTADARAFGTAVLQATTELTAGVQRLYLFEATSHDQNQLQYHYCERHVEALFPTYSRCYLRQDPIGEAYRAAAAHSDVVLQRVRPHDINSNGLRRQFFENSGIVERISVVQRDRHAWRGMSLARHERQGYFSDDELNNLLGLAFLALPLLSRRQERRESGPLPLSELETRFATCFPQLTSRERQVCARAVSGMTVDATAQDLGIARTSVLTYRQRAYLRLNVNSSVELSALVAH